MLQRATVGERSRPGECADARIEVVNVAVDGRGRPINIRISQLVCLEVSPGFSDGYPANLCLYRGIDLEAQIVDRSLCFSERLVLFDGSDDAFVLDSLAGGRRFAPPVDPDIRSFGAGYSVDRAFVVTAAGMSDRHDYLRIAQAGWPDDCSCFAI